MRALLHPSFPRRRESSVTRGSAETERLMSPRTRLLLDSRLRGNDRVNNA